MKNRLALNPLGIALTGVGGVRLSRGGASSAIQNAGELASFGAHLEEKPMIMVASKIDGQIKRSWLR